MGCVQSYFRKAHNAGLSPSSTHGSEKAGIPQDATADVADLADYPEKEPLEVTDIQNEDEINLTEKPSEFTTEPNGTVKTDDKDAVKVIAAATGTAAVIGVAAAAAAVASSDEDKKEPIEEAETFTQSGNASVSASPAPAHIETNTAEVSEELDAKSPQSVKSGDDAVVVEAAGETETEESGSAPEDIARADSVVKSLEKAPSESVPDDRLSTAKSEDSPEQGSRPASASQVVVKEEGGGSRPTSAVIEGPRPTSASSAKEDSVPEQKQYDEGIIPPSEQESASSRPQSAEEQEKESQKEIRPVSATELDKKESRPTSTTALPEDNEEISEEPAVEATEGAHVGSRPATPADGADRPTSGAQETVQPISATGSRPKSVAESTKEEGSRPVSSAVDNVEASEEAAGSRPVSVAVSTKEEGSRPVSVAELTTQEKSRPASSAVETVEVSEEPIGSRPVSVSKSTKDGGSRPVSMAQSTKEETSRPVSAAVSTKEDERNCAIDNVEISEEHAGSRPISAAESTKTEGSRPASTVEIAKEEQRPVSVTGSIKDEGSRPTSVAENDVSETPAVSEQISDSAQEEGSRPFSAGDPKKETERPVSAVESVKNEGIESRNSIAENVEVTEGRSESRPISVSGSTKGEGSRPVSAAVSTKEEESLKASPTTENEVSAEPGESQPQSANEGSRSESAIELTKEESRPVSGAGSNKEDENRSASAAESTKQEERSRPVSAADLLKEEGSRSASAPAKDEGSRSVSVAGAEKEAGSRPASVAESTKDEGSKPVSATGSAKEEGSRPASTAEPAKEEGNIPVTAAGAEKEDGSRPVSVAESTKDEGSRPVSVAGAEKDDGNRPASVAESTKDERSRPVSATGSEKDEGSRPGSAAEPEKEGGNIPVTVAGADKEDGSRSVSVAESTKDEGSRPVSVAGAEKEDGSRPASVAESTKDEGSGSFSVVGSVKEEGNRAASLVESTKGEESRPVSAVSSLKGEGTESAKEKGSGPVSVAGSTKEESRPTSTVELTKEEGNRPASVAADDPNPIEAPRSRPVSVSGSIREEGSISASSATEMLDNSSEPTGVRPVSATESTIGGSRLVSSAAIEKSSTEEQGQSEVEQESEEVATDEQTSKSRPPISATEQEILKTVSRPSSAAPSTGGQEEAAEDERSTAEVDDDTRPLSVSQSIGAETNITKEEERSFSSVANGTVESPRDSEQAHTHIPSLAATESADEPESDAEAGAPIVENDTANEDANEKKPVQDEMAALNTAATSIQATFRGFQTRQALSKAAEKYEVPQPVTSHDFLFGTPVQQSVPEPEQSLVSSMPVSPETEERQEMDNELVDLQKPQECDEIRTAQEDASEDVSDADSSVSTAATKIQAGVRGFLTRRHIHHTKTSNSTTAPSIGDSQQSLGDTPVSQEVEDEGVQTSGSMETEVQKQHQVTMEDISQPTTEEVEVQKGLSLDSQLEDKTSKPAVARSAISLHLDGQVNDEEDHNVWQTLQQEELDNAATKIQSNFRGYRTRRSLKREDAVQMPTTSTSSSEVIPEPIRHSGEFHDMVVLPPSPEVDATDASAQNHVATASSTPLQPDDDVTAAAGNKETDVTESNQDGGAKMDERAGVTTSQAAATKIQASYRGFKTRQDIKTANTAASKIQAGFRGYKVRKQLRENTEDDNMNSPRNQGSRPQSANQEVETTNASPAGDIEERSATKIQAGVRGYLVRKKRQAERDAAVKIQAGFRGYQARRDVKAKQQGQ